METSWFQRCVDWCKRGFGVQKQVSDQVAAVNVSDEMSAPKQFNGVPPSALAQADIVLSEKPPAEMPYTPMQLTQAQVRLKEMELLLVNYTQVAAIASTSSDSNMAQVEEAQIFIQEMTACISELSQLLADIQKENHAAG